jgi:carbonic anhydrase
MTTMMRNAWLISLALMSPAQAEPNNHAPPAQAQGVGSADPVAPQEAPALPVSASHATPASHAAPAPLLSNADVLLRLRDGNTRYVAGMSQFRLLDSDRRCDTFHHGQHPIATVLSCADSRVPVEHLFDAGVGELFVIRVAGNVASSEGIASIEYASGHLGSNVIVVMGHTKCGAVGAALDNAQLEGHLPKLLEQIKPAVDAVRSPSIERSRQLDRAVESNVRLVQRRLIEQSDEIKRLVSLGTVEVHGAIYDLHNGIVLWLGPHPLQSELIGGLASDKTVEMLTDQRVVSTEVHGPVPAHAYAPAAQAPTKSHVAVDAHAAGDSHTPGDHSALTHDKPTKAASHENDSHSDAGHADTGHDQQAADPNASAADKQGLLVPAAFMLGGVALSTGILFALRGRRVPASATT